MNTQKKIASKIMENLQYKFNTLLPNEGYLAGSAVANWMFGKQRHIGDIDIFREDSCNVAHGKVRHEFITDEKRSSFDLFDNHIIKDDYRIIRTERDGNMNTITYNNSISLLYLLRSFDLNCCQAGIDLSTGEYMYTPEFDEFLMNNIIRIIHPATPIHSFFRAIKKARQFSMFFDKDLYKEIVEFVLFATGTLLYYTESEILRNCFSQYCSSVMGKTTKELIDSEGGCPSNWNIVPVKKYMSDRKTIYVRVNDCEADRWLLIVNESYEEMLRKFSRHFGVSELRMGNILDLMHHEYFLSRHDSCYTSSSLLIQNYLNPPKMSDYAKMNTSAREVSSKYDSTIGVCTDIEEHYTWRYNYPSLCIRNELINQGSDENDFVDGIESSDDIPF